MIDLPYKDKFSEIPTIDVDDIVKYFNLEFGLEFTDEPVNKFKAEDFKFRGLYKVENRETMVWTVNGQDVCAIVQPYEDSYILAMGPCPDEIVSG